jgi:hypothetical protein
MCIVVDRDRCTNRLGTDCGNSVRRQDLTSEMLKRRMHARVASGSLFSEKVWCILFKLVLERFHKKLRMGEVLSNIMKPKHYLSSKAFDFFRQTYHFVGRFEKNTFLQCREAAIQMLACLCVDHLRSKEEQFDKFILSSSKACVVVQRARERARE